MDRTRERRFTGSCELRAIAPEGDGRSKIAGHAAVFNSLSEELWGFREKIAPGAFKPALAKSDIRALLNHDPNYVLGRTKSGTLRVQEDETGLAVEIDPPETAWADDLLVSISRGDISQMSFAFRVGEESWETVDGVNCRTILSFDEIFDVSPVTYPAYLATDMALHIMPEVEGIDLRKVAAAIVRVERRLRPEPGDAATIKECIQILQSMCESPAQPSGDSDVPQDGPRVRSLNQLKCRLRILELENSIEEIIQ
jgi:HK97 family phage prohead protease